MARARRLRVATFNINNINKRLPNLLAWLDATQPDIVALQELKAKDSAFPLAAVEAAGYGAVWQGEKTWNGVALLARGAEPVIIRRRLPGDDEDGQARYIEAAIGGIVVASIYAPNGNPQPGPKFAYKLAWMKRLIAHAAELRAAGVPVILAGDYNIAPTEIDIYPTKSWDDDALIQPGPRRSFHRLVNQCWTDALRHLHPDERIYSFWTYWRGRFDRDHGLRLDHILLSPDLAGRLEDAGVDRDARGRDGASDHAPVWALLER
ncbi:Exodeoxyribonuclease III [Bosea lupini]|uniref:Exodeoxyribonuclease III n=1 Tax=Bosea lupini TaxID=1036779 RepID=A0A1H7WI23_9HYPH|nr:exodeoxyribonuclease III [Bosea lupini]SEM20658.1 Exodeoxyribonuclease III [Bosea lupini]